MFTTDSLDDLKMRGHPPSIRLHSLKGSWKGYLAIDIDKISGWRIVFKWKDNRFHDVQILDYH